MFLGIDVSTQQLKSVLLNDQGTIIREDAIHFDTCLPHYKTCNGVHRHDQTVTTPPLLWVEALDQLLTLFQREKVPLNKIMGISGCAQQHGSVYWKQGAADVLGQVTSGSTLTSQLQECFACPSPIWQDSSTTQECRILEEYAGGPLELARLTGSRAYERFTGPQIMKIATKQPHIYNQTEHISLISSFVSSLFMLPCINYAPVELSDASGMNLLDIEQRQWSTRLIEKCAHDLAKKLGPVVQGNIACGKIGKYFVERYQFHPDCQIYPFLGDNPSTLVDLMSRTTSEKSAFISLGTSDTLFLSTPRPMKPCLVGHYFVHPLLETHNMVLLCYSNGSLTREWMRDQVAKGDWNIFEEYLAAPSKAHCHQVGLYFKVPEISPKAHGIFVFKKGAQGLEPKTTFTREDAGLLVESQFMNIKYDCEQRELDVSQLHTLYVTGGASMNTSILQVMANVFQTRICRMTLGGSCAAQGGALRAMYLAQRQHHPDLTFQSFVQSLGGSLFDSISPQPHTLEYYKDAYDLFKQARVLLDSLEDKK